ncbi:hypothetical protein K501DRAFT_284517 [Backusella circina FSU 941]|nr:hypothetical protein K501DRAFT_284517 [Backusella circina FSU 941]
MRNVNNWHWVNKDCLPWAKTYFQDQLSGLTAEKNGIKVKINHLDECTGDVDLNQRKGKILAIYDVALSLSWEAQDESGTKIFGNIRIPEVAYDTALDDYVFNISINGSDAIADQTKKVIRSELEPKLRHKFSLFTNDLIKRHSSDVYQGESPSTPQTPELVQRKQPLQKQESASHHKQDQPIRTTKSQHSYDFKGSTSQDVYEALLDLKRALIWSKGKAKVSKRIGSEFELFDGNVHGTLLEAIPGQKIIQTWRLKSWPKDHFSTVTLTITQTEDGATLQLNQSGIPSGQEEAIKQNWMGYYWKPIDANLSAGIFDGMPIQRDAPSHSHWIILMMVTLIVLLIATTAYVVAPKL